MNRDKEIREQLKKKDYEHVERMKQEMEEEQKNMQRFFQESKKVTGKDPTLRKKSKYDHKVDTLRQAMKDFNIFGFYSAFWKYKASTPEQEETLFECKKNITQRLLVSSAIGMLLTTGVNLYYRAYLPLPVKVSGLLLGGIGGGIYGLIRSTEFTLKKLEELGSQYPLGRLAVNDIQDYRMDKVNPNNSP